MNNAKVTIENLIAQTQDGKKLGDDIYGTFLQECIDNCTDLHEFTDADELADNLRYAISEFSRALKAITPIAERVRALKDYRHPNTKWTTLSPDEFNRLMS